jgi:D-xylose transport system substrate-binding protein
MTQLMIQTAGLASAGALSTLLSSTVALAQADGATVAFLMPDQASTRYEEHDYPGFQAAMAELCPTCTVVYQNANADVALQQQQFQSVLRRAPGRSCSTQSTPLRGLLVQQARAQGVKVIAYDRPIPDNPADFYCQLRQRGHRLRHRPEPRRSSQG